MIAHLPQSTSFPEPGPETLEIIEILGLRGWDIWIREQGGCDKKVKACAPGTMYICGSSWWLSSPLYPTCTLPWV